MNRISAAVVAAALVLGGVAIGASPAQAGGAGLALPLGGTDLGADIANSQATISSVAPELLGETSTSAPVDLAEGGSEGAPAVSVAEPDNADGVLSPGISFTVDYATDIAAKSAGITTLGTDDDDVAAYVQPMASGVRVLTAIGSPDAPTSYSYTFDVPADTVLSENGAGYYLESGSETIGALQPAWAADSEGNSIPTEYSWADGILTQTVDLSSPDIAYPVLADPAWSYAFSYTTTKTPGNNWTLLKSCFNCYFPVTGAPRAFPSAGTLLPLTVGPANFECKFARQFTAANYYGFQFDATKNHVDGLGSNIIFEFKIVGGVNKLVVSAYIVNDAYWLKNPAYALGAQANWANFATKLNNA